MLFVRAGRSCPEIFEGFLIPIAGPLHKLVQEPLPYTVALPSFYLCPFHHRGSSHIDVQGQHPQQTIDGILTAFLRHARSVTVMVKCSALGVMRKLLPSLSIADRILEWCHTSVIRWTAR